MDPVDTLGCIGLGLALIYGLALSMDWWMRPRMRCPCCGRRMSKSYLTPGVWYCSNRKTCGKVLVEVAQ